MNDLLKAALWYCRAGYPVFPLAPGSKIPMAGSRGFLDATTDEAQIRLWWEANPTANIGLATAGLCAIDFDLDDDETWFRSAGVQAMVCASPMRQRTPSGGMHVLFKQPADTHWRISASVLANAVDVRADGGYIVAAPSQVDSLDYEWIEGPAALTDLPTPPGWLVSRLNDLSKNGNGSRNGRAGGNGRSNLAGTWDDWQGDKIKSGSRHQALLSWAGLFRSWGLSGPEMEAALLAVNENRCDPPTAEKEVRRIARDYARKAVDEAKARAAGVDGDFSLPGLDAKLAVVAGDVSEAADPGPIDEELLLMVPGFVRDVLNHTLETAPYPNPVLAWTGAMTLMSFLASRKVHFQGVAPNVYLLGLALSGGGKEHPRKVNAEILTRLGLSTCLGDRFASSEGLEDALNETPAMLYQTDEIDGMLEASAGTETRFRAIRDMVLSLYGESSGVHVGRRKAGKQEPIVIQLPSLTLFGTAIPNHCYGAMTEEMVTKGLLSRMLIVDSVRGERQPWSGKNLPQAVLDRAAFWRDFNPGGGNLESLTPTPLEVDVAESTAVFLAAEEQDHDSLYREAQAKGDNVTCGMTSRVMLQARKLALLWACSTWDGKGRPVVSLEAAQWAVRVVQHCGARMRAMFAMNAKTTLDFERRADKVLAYITKAGGAIGHSRLANLMKLPKRDLRDLIDTLIDRRVIDAVSKADGRGRPGVVYTKGCE
jgi:hypothetical protein